MRDIVECFEEVNKAWRQFEHRNQNLSERQLEIRLAEFHMSMTCEIRVGSGKGGYKRLESLLRLNRKYAPSVYTTRWGARWDDSCGLVGNRLSYERLGR